VAAEVELSQLEQQEQIIERGIKSFVEVGVALMKIRDEELYREAGFGGFVEYLESKPWGIGQAHAYRMIGASEVATVIHLDKPLNEGQARELAPLMRQATPEVVKQVYDEVVVETEGKPTAKKIREKVRKLLRPAKRAKKSVETQAVSDAELLLKVGVLLADVREYVAANPGSPICTNLVELLRETLEVIELERMVA
jgi:hypothetical protein